MMSEETDISEVKLPSPTIPRHREMGYSSWRSFQEIFFTKSRPRFMFKKSFEYPEIPMEDEAYQLKLAGEGFISQKQVQQFQLDRFPRVMRDMEDLEEHIMPRFWEYNQLSKYYQNRFYLYQWVFMFGALLTTVFAVLTTHQASLLDINPIDSTAAQAEVTATPAQDQDATATNSTTDQNQDNPTPRILAILTALVSGGTTFATIRSRQGEPRMRWATYRRLAEELRMTYFNYLSRVPPYDRADRVDTMRRRVIEIRREEISGNG